MIIYYLLTITLLYYLILWKILARKVALERATKEVFGPASSIQEFLASKDTLEKSSKSNNTQQQTPSAKEEIFGEITNIQDLTSKPMSKQSIIAAVSVATKVRESPFVIDQETARQNSSKEPPLEEHLRHNIFAGSSLAKDETNNVPTNNLAIKATIDNLNDKILEAELNAIVDELGGTPLDENSLLPTTNTLLTYTMDSLEKNELVGQLNQLFEKDYQDYV